MNRIPVIDMTATGINITRLRVNAGLTVKDLFTSGSAERHSRPLTTLSSLPQCSA